MKFQDDLSYEFVSSILNYNSDTGIFFWKYRKDANYEWNYKNVGKIAGIINSDIKNKYIKISINGKTYMAHRLAWLLFYQEWPSDTLDHRNRIKTDNRIKNLRIINHPNNQANVGLRIDSKTGYKGVGLHRATGKYRARIVRYGKRYDLGYYDNPQLAYDAYKEAALRLHGEYANF